MANDVISSSSSLYTYLYSISLNEQTGNGESECSLFSLSTVNSVQTQMIQEQQLNKYQVSYSIQLTAQPGDAVFEAMIVDSAVDIASINTLESNQNSNTNNNNVDIKDESERSIERLMRISKYSHQETCSDHPYRPSFCVCKVRTSRSSMNVT